MDTDIPADFAAVKNLNLALGKLRPKIWAGSAAQLMACCPGITAERASAVTSGKEQLSEEEYLALRALDTTKTLLPDAANLPLSPELQKKYAKILLSPSARRPPAAPVKRPVPKPSRPAKPRPLEPPEKRQHRPTRVTVSPNAQGAAIVKKEAWANPLEEEKRLEDLYHTGLSAHVNELPMAERLATLRYLCAAFKDLPGVPQAKASYPSGEAQEKALRAILEKALPALRVVPDIAKRLRVWQSLAYYANPLT